MKKNVVRTTVRGALMSAAVYATALGQVFATPLTHSGLPGELAQLNGKSPAEILSSAPLSFEVNAGQFAAPVKYVARSPSQEIRFTPDAVQFDLLGGGTSNTVTMTFTGHAKSPALGAQEIVQKQSHYFIGNDAAQWRTHIPNFARVAYSAMYPGIDVAFYGNGSELEYDVIVAPGAELEKVRLNFAGADRVHVTDAGDLVLEVGERQWLHRKPVAYQMIDGQRRGVDSRYVALNETEIGFAAGEFDHAHALVVDPVIVASRYFSYQGLTTVVGMAVTPTGQVVIAGRAENGLNGTRWNAYVAYLSADLTQVLSATWIGGINDDEPNSVALDGQGNAYITGTTGSADFPTTVNAFQRTYITTNAPATAFVTKLSNDGATLLYSTFLGGTGYDAGRGIAVDDLGAAYVAGITVSTNFPLRYALMTTKRSEVYTTFISKLNPAGSALEFSTYFGGAGSNQTQSGATNIAVDAEHNIYVAGVSDSPSFPQLNAVQSGLRGSSDISLIKIGADYQLKFSTLFGGTLADGAIGMAVDDQQRVTLVGSTASVNFPTQNAFQPANGGGTDAIVARIDTVNSTLIFSTYLGGAKYDRAWGAALDRAGIVYVVGETQTANFPLKNAFQSNLRSSTDGFVTALGTLGELQFSSYLGGNATEYGAAVVVAQDGAIFIAGTTSSSDFPNTVGVAYGKAFITKLSKLNLAPVSVAGTDLGVNEGEPTVLNGSASYDPNGDAITYQWTQVAGPAVVLNAATSAQPNFIAPNVAAGGATLTFQLVVSDGALTSAPSLVNVTVKDVNHAPVADAGSNQAVTEGSPVTLNGAQSYDVDGDIITYLWQQVSGAAVILTSTTDAVVQFGAPFVTISGDTLRFSLTVNDGVLSNTAYVDVRVDNVNHAPLAHAGADQTVNEQSVVTLNGTASQDPDGDGLTYEWHQVSGLNTVSLSDNTAATPTFSAPSVNLGGDQLEFELRVRDQELTSNAARVIITVLNLNDPPACDLARADVTLLWPPNHKLIPLTITGVRDPNNDAVTVNITGVTSDEPVNGLGDGDTTPDAVVSEGRASVRAERAGNRNGRVYAVNFTATDGQGASCSGTVTVAVPQSKNSVPVDSGQSYDATRP